MENRSIFTSSFFADNRRKLRENFGGTAPIVIVGNSLVQKSMDSSYPFTQDSNFWYLTGISEPGLVLVMDGTKEYIVAAKTDDVHKAFYGEKDYESYSKTSGIKDVYAYDEGWQRLRRKVKKVKHIATVQPAPAYVESAHMFTHPSRASLVLRLKEANPEVDLIDLRSHLASMRAIKNDLELSAIELAIKQTMHAYQIIEKKRDKVTYEYELMAELQRETTKLQASFAYEPIIASGKNGLILHYESNNAPIEPGGFLLLDIGLRQQNYCADITRTVTAEPTKRQLAVYDAVGAVHEFACSILKPGTNLVTYEQAVFQYMGEKLRELGLIRTIEKETVREYYPHASSHFLGIDVHDVGSYDEPLKPGVVMTVEPGIYIKEEGIAVRLEDDILITDTGIRNLSEHLPKDPSKL